MASIANITVTEAETVVTVTEAVQNITVTDVESNVIVTEISIPTDNITVSSTESNIVISSVAIASVSNSEIRAAISNVAPILYNSSTGVISFDANAAFSNALANAWFTTQTTDNLTQGNTNLYFSNTLTNAAIEAYNGNITTTGNISANYLFGNGSFLTNVGITENQFISLLQKYKGLINIIDGGTSNNEFEGGAANTTTFNDQLDGGTSAG